MNCPTCGLDIDEHPANRCLDAWVDQAVIGRSIYYDSVTGEPPAGYYSTDDTAAFSAADLLIAKGLEFSLGWVKHRGEWLWYAHFSESMFWDDKQESMAESRSLAICRAALKVATEDNVDG